MVKDKTIQEIIDCLRPIGPHKIILFGSRAKGKHDVNSDIDLLVVTDENFIPRNFREKNAVYLKVARALKSVQEKVPVDLIVHTRAMHKRFIGLDSMFSREILRNGKIVYEKSN